MSAHHQGKLIVIEGGDGSGKGTQSQLLIEYLKKNNIPFEYVDFPKYDSFYGKMIAQFLRGEYGNLESISPYLAALLFAEDRKESQNEIQKYLDDGKMVIANRYVTSNMAHQGSRIADMSSREAFIKWLDELEYIKNHMPRENIVIYLKIPWEIASELTKQKHDRDYLNGQKEDIQEKDAGHRTQTADMYDLLASTNKHWVTIDCTENGTILSKEKIHQMIISKLQL